MERLPIDTHLPDIVTALRKSGALVLTAPPGSGKTTRIPRMLYDEGFAENGEILILEPRRLAARLAASRVAHELGEAPGETVGYSIRFENVSGPKTRIRFLTEAILARRIIHDPDLKGVSVVLLDEFHERHLATDLALAFLKRLQAENSRLRIVVMSATLDAGPIASYLPHAQTISLAQARYDLNIEYEERPDNRPLHEKVASAVLKLFRSGIDGDILIFLPGSAEIRRAAEALRPIEDRLGFAISILHGDLPASEQRRALEPCAKIKVILSTNVAETSITIPGIGAVIDSGLARIAGHSAWSGFSTISTAKISKSSAVQRAGRAGRTQAGHILRLYTEADFNGRPAQETPEIRRADLTETALMLHGAGISDIRAFPWFEAPVEPALEAAETLLEKLGAVNSKGCISDLGRRMLQLPVHPRIARLILEGEKLQVTKECALLAALVSERDIRLNVRTNVGLSRSRTPQASGVSDLLELMEYFEEAELAHFQAERMRSLGLDARAVHSVRQAHRQLQRLMPAARAANLKAVAEDQRDEALLMAVLAAFPDRVARRRRAGSRDLILAGGGSAQLSPTSVVQNPLFLVAVDVEERKDFNSLKQANTWIRLASAIEIEWLADLFPEDIIQKTELIWNETAKRVEEVKRTAYGQVMLEEYASTAPPSPEASQLLASAVLDHGLSMGWDYESLVRLQNRLTLLAKNFPREMWPQVGEAAIEECVRKICNGKRSFDEIASASLADALQHQLSGHQQSLLKKEAPERVSLKSGRSVTIHYESAQPPWIESRIQDFFGTRETPRICAGQVPLTIHLLAPNQRAVQVTQDLAGFWERHYPQIRRELMRRYPKHAWPEKSG